MAGTNGLDPRDQLIEKSKCPSSPTKRKYPNSEEAWEAARYRTAESGIEIVAYACPGCGYFHLSKKVKGSDVVVKAPVGISTGALRAKTPSIMIGDFHREELPPEGPIVPGNVEARRKALASFLEGVDSVSTAEIVVGVGIGRHSVAKYMGELGWRIGRGPGAKWQRQPGLTALPAITGEDSELEAAMSRHPSSRTSQDEWWTIEAFPPGVSVHDYLLTLKTAGLIVEVRVRRA